MESRHIIAKLFQPQLIIVFYFANFLSSHGENFHSNFKTGIIQYNTIINFIALIGQKLRYHAMLNQSQSKSITQNTKQDYIKQALKQHRRPLISKLRHMTYKYKVLFKVVWITMLLNYMGISASKISGELHIFTPTISIENQLNWIITI